MTQTQDERILDIEPAQVKTMLEKGEAVLVDVREAGEHAQICIPGAVLHPLSSFNPFHLTVGAGKKLVLHCAGGNRSRQAAELCLAAGFEEIAHVKGGIKAWQEADLATEKGPAT